MYIQASVARNVDGLDLDLFEQALAARRSFLEKQVSYCTFYYFIFILFAF